MARKTKGACTSHRIRNVVIEELLLEGLKLLTAFAKNHEDEFIQIVMNQFEQDLSQKQRKDERTYEEAQARIKALDTIIEKLYKDNVFGRYLMNVFTKCLQVMKQSKMN